jgi:hypothetical protein
MAPGYAYPFGPPSVSNTKITSREQSPEPAIVVVRCGTHAAPQPLFGRFLPRLGPLIRGRSFFVQVYVNINILTKFLATHLIFKRSS